MNVHHNTFFFFGNLSLRSADDHKKQKRCQLAYPVFLSLTVRHREKSWWLSYRLLAAAVRGVGFCARAVMYRTALKGTKHTQAAFTHCQMGDVCRDFHVSHLLLYNALALAVPCLNKSSEFLTESSKGPHTDPRKSPCLDLRKVLTHTPESRHVRTLEKSSHRP